MDLCIFPKSANMTHSQSAISNLAFGNYSWTWSVSKQRSVPQQHSAIPAKSATIKVSEQHFVPQWHSVDQQHPAITSKAGEPSLSSFRRAGKIFQHSTIPVQYHYIAVPTVKGPDVGWLFTYMVVVFDICLGTWWSFQDMVCFLGYLSGYLSGILAVF